MADRAETFPPTNRKTEATGYSRGKSSDWSFNDAIDQLGSANTGDVNDWQDHYVMTEIGARIGGIAFTSELYVTVKMSSCRDRLVTALAAGTIRRAAEYPTQAEPRMRRRSAGRRQAHDYGVAPSAVWT